MLIGKNRNTLVLCLAILIGAIIWFLPPEGGLTAAGVKLLSVFVVTIVLWIGIGTGWTSLFVLLALVILQIIDVNTVFSTAWGSSVPNIVIPLFIIVNVMIDSGAMQYITEWILSRKIIHGKPYVFLLMLCVAITLLGTAVYAVVMCCFLLEFVDDVCTSIGYSKDDKFYKAILLLALWICTIMDGVWPFARPIPALVIAYLAPLGYEISVLQWIAVSIPFTILCIACALFIIKFIYRPDTSKFKRYDDQAIRERLKSKPLSRSGKVSIICLILVILSWLLAGLNIPVISPYLSSIGSPTAAYLAVLVMCFLKGDDEKPIIDLSTALAKVNWSLVLFIGTMMLFAAAVGEEQYGIVAMVGNYLAPLAEILSYGSIISLGLIIVCLLTNFMSSTVATTMVVTLFVPMLLTYNNVTTGDVITFGVLIGCISNCAYLTHAACPAAGVMLSNIPPNESVKYNVIMVLLACLLGTFVFQPLMAHVI